MTETKDTKTLEGRAGGAEVYDCFGVTFRSMSEPELEIACEKFRRETRPLEYQKERQGQAWSDYKHFQEAALSGYAMAVSSSFVTPFFTTLALQEGKLGPAALIACIGGILGVAGYVTHRHNHQPRDTAYQEYRAWGGTKRKVGDLDAFQI